MVMSPVYKQKYIKAHTFSSPECGSRYMYNFIPIGLQLTLRFALPSMPVVA